MGNIFTTPLRNRGRITKHLNRASRRVSIPLKNMILTSSLTLMRSSIPREVLPIGKMGKGGGPFFFTPQGGPVNSTGVLPQASEIQQVTG
jgi:hypothetical protein